MIAEILRRMRERGHVHVGAIGTAKRPVFTAALTACTLLWVCSDVARSTASASAGARVPVAIPRQEGGSGTGLLFPYVTRGPRLWPRLIGRLGGQRISGMYVDERYAYLVMDANWSDRLRLRIVDVSNASEPRGLGETDVLPGAHESSDDPHYFYSASVAVVSDRAFVLRPGVHPSYRGGVYTVDVADRSRPEALAHVPVGGRSLAHRGGFGYVGAHYLDGLEVVDLRDPRRPLNVGTFEGIGGASLAISGDLLLSTRFASEFMQVIDVSSPTRPHLLADARVIGFWGERQNVLVTAEGERAYTVTDVGDQGPSGVRIFDVGNPSRPRAVGEVLADASGVGLFINDVAVAGHRLYVTEQRAGVHVFDISDPSRPRPTTGVGLQGLAVAVEAPRGGRRVYAADTEVGLHIFRGERSGLSRAGTYPVMTSINYAEVVGDVAYIAADSGMWIVDISEPGRPREIGHLNLTDRALWIGRGEATVFLVTVDERMAAVDIRDPRRPRLLGTMPAQVRWDNRVEGYRIGEVVGDRVVLWHPGGRITVVDASVPAEMAVASEIDVGATGFHADANRLYVCSGGEIALFDITDPYDVVEMARGTLPVPVYSPYAFGDGVLIGAGRDGDFKAFDVSDIAAPRQIWTSWLGSSVKSILTAGNLLVVSARDGLRVMTLPEATGPRQVAFARVGRDSLVVGLGRHLYLVHKREGLKIVALGF
jgi:hypothetical protein